MNGHVPRKIPHLPIFMPPRGFLPSRPAHKNPSPGGRDPENFNLLSRASYGAEKLLHRRKMFLWVLYLAIPTHQPGPVPAWVLELAGGGVGQKTGSARSQEGALVR